MKASNWREHSKGSLQGFFSLHLDSGIEIRSMTLHQKDGRTWVSFPAKPYQDDTGETKYQSLLAIPDDGKWKRFQREAQEAVALIRQSGGEREEGNADVPF